MTDEDQKSTDFGPERCPTCSSDQPGKPWRRMPASDLCTDAFHGTPASEPTPSEGGLGPYKCMVCQERVESGADHNCVEFMVTRAEAERMVREALGRPHDLVCNAHTVPWGGPGCSCRGRIVRGETERCAKVAQKFWVTGSPLADKIAAAIRDGVQNARK